MSGKRLAIGLWLALAFVTWNVVFERQVSLASARFTRDNVERHLRGDEVPTLDAAYRPHVRVAAQSASLWAGGVLAAGAVTLGLAGRSRRRYVPS
jgi:hypothetical protein